MGEIRVAEDSDFKKLKDMLETSDGWFLEFSKPGIAVWTKPSPKCTFKMVKVICMFPGLNSSDIYDVLHDPDYRKLWDHSMLESEDICHVNPNNDISYYAVTCPTPMKNRDFVLQRSWLDTGQEKYIINHSVEHPKYPIRRGFIRGTSHFTGYLITAGYDSDFGGCRLGYITHTDPQGDLPNWLVDRCTKLFAPKYVRQLEKASRTYYEWKRNHRPDFKPWLHPEQITSPRLSLIHQQKSKVDDSSIYLSTAVGNPSIDVVEKQPVSQTTAEDPKPTPTIKKTTTSKKKLFVFLALGKKCLGKHEEPSDV